jgi:cyclic pyranopterin phosphate synthase
VLTKFNRREVPQFLEFAIDNGLNIKFFEHLRVLPPLPGALTNRMAPRPQVAEEWFMATLRETLGHLPDFAATDAFAPATSAAVVAGSEIRYCRYLCTYQRCWAPGTRLDPEGYVYTCMSSRGLDRISPDMAPSRLRTTIGLASNRPCSAVTGASS